MRCGISTSCFYPQNTLDSLDRVIRTGSPVTEVFLNTFSELEQGFVASLEKRVQQSGIEVVSIHPFSSMMEGFLFATPYDQRFLDGMAFYRQYFELCQRVGATRLVFHGDHKNAVQVYPLEAYADHYNALAEMGDRYGVTLCHENVFYCRLGDPEVVREFRQILGSNVSFVLDTKQVVRQGAQIQAMLDAMGTGIQHVHISDYTKQCDCLPPGMGDFDYPSLIHRLAAQGYAGDLIIELYNNGFETPDQLVEAMHYIEGLIQEETKEDKL